MNTIIDYFSEMLDCFAGGCKALRSAVIHLNLAVWILDKPLTVSSYYSVFIAVTGANFNIDAIKFQ